MNTNTTSSSSSSSAPSKDNGRKSHSPEIDVDGLKPDCSSPEKVEKQPEAGGGVEQNTVKQRGNEVKKHCDRSSLNDNYSNLRIFSFSGFHFSIFATSKNTLSTPNQRPRTTSSTFDGTEALIATLSAWDWVTIDGLKLPAVSRNKERYVAVHMVQLKLLSKFPSDIPSEITRKFTMSSFKMTVAEAWTFNSINAVIRKFDLGCQLFTANDELVKLNDVQLFYLNVKLLNLYRVNKDYEKAIATTENNIQLLATAMQLKEQVESDIQAVRAELGRLEKSYIVSESKLTD
ncbi:Protein CBG23732 [Caenorhabditis briggsae]|uniref:Protein CBG23732 n=2 Tax=Caenorhabditis briggsae TaxID=6238 RepID=A8WJ60_CAEBR|nr:Protein CBG23732 [Caenorhabditis briggsae]CAP20502.2 Protein CBG23732 [Caenorhabditis briggsae]